MSYLVYLTFVDNWPLKLPTVPTGSMRVGARSLESFETVKHECVCAEKLFKERRNSCYAELKSSKRMVFNRTANNRQTRD